MWNGCICSYQNPNTCYWICKYITEEQSLLLVDHSLSKNCHGNPEAIQKHQSLDVYMVEGCLLCAMHTTWNLWITKSCPKIRLARVTGKHAAAKQPISELQHILSHSPSYGKKK